VEVRGWELEHENRAWEGRAAINIKTEQYTAFAEI